MPELSLSGLTAALDDFLDPALRQRFLDLDALQLELDGDTARVRLCLGYPAAGLQAELEAGIRQRLAGIAGLKTLDVKVESAIADSGGAKTDSLAGVKNIIAVASGKGGVGKSTTTVNLALALVREGARVGLLDADIYGPSQPQMLGVGAQRPQVVNNQSMLPIEAHGIKANSMGFLVTEQTPMVWRGPMVSGTFQQLVRKTDWGELDYLLIDMPPGTGDVQLTLSQTVPVSGAVIVTTPQDIALLDAKKGIEMFRKVNVPVLGVVENMATHICSQCGHEEHVFGHGGGQRIASQYQVPLLGSLPLDLSIREQADGGNPTVAAAPDSAIARSYRQIARRVGAELWLLSRHSAAPQISIEDD